MARRYETNASLFGESVAIFDGDGLLAARAGRAFDAGNESSDGVIS